VPLRAFLAALQVGAPAWAVDAIPPIVPAKRRLARIDAEADPGADWASAGWYLGMLAKAERGELPVAYADWYDEPDPRWLPTTAACRCRRGRRRILDRGGT